MMVVELLTRDGEVIGHFRIPPFPDPPPILFWQDCVFEWTSFGMTYREIFRTPPEDLFSYKIVTPKM